MSEFSRGSEWRRWDLHIHTPNTIKNDSFEGASIEAKWDLFYKNIEEYISDGTNPLKNIAVIGVTDYLSIDNYKKIVSDNKLPRSIKLILPNVEMRIQPMAKDTPINIHFIFDPAIVDSLESRFFSKLRFPYGTTSFSAARDELIRLGMELNTNADNVTAYKLGISQFIPSLDSIQDVFKDSDLRSSTIVVVSNGNSDGASGLSLLSSYCEVQGDPSQLTLFRQSVYKFSDAIFSAKPCDIAYFIGEKSDKPEVVIGKCGSLKPCIHGSDAHTNYRIFEPDDKKYCWIKADPTFNGLRQILYEPKERVFIGDTPECLDRVNKNKQNYISSVSVSRVANPKNRIESWFDFDLQLNSGLVSIIGNKGSGKSALSDIIGHFANCKTMGSASFLNPERFRKSTKSYALDYEGFLTWYDGQIDEKVNLQSSSRSLVIENAQYLPQRYIEDICNDLGDGFRKEINHVIFSYVDVTERGTASNLDQLIQQKSVAVNEAINRKYQELSETNHSITALEDKLLTSYITIQKEGLVKCQDKLDRHVKNKPQEVKNDPLNNDPEYLKELERINSSIDELNTQVSEKSHRLTKINIAIDDLKAIEARVANSKVELEKLNIELLAVSTTYEVDDLLVEANFDTPLARIKMRIGAYLNEKQQILQLLDSSANADPAISLNIKLAAYKLEKERLISTADVKEKVFQKYIEDLKIWELQKANIIGNKTEPDTIEFYKNEVEYIEKYLQSDYKRLCATQMEQIKGIFDLKVEIANIYSMIYSPIEKQLDLLVGDMDDKIIFASELSLNNVNIGEELLNYINKSYNGIFYGTVTASAKMNTLLKSTDFNNWDSTASFIKSVLQVVTEDIDSSSKKVRDKEEFYNKLAELKYVDAQYHLKVGGRSLDELSPGEKGIVLLIFYLALSKDERPLIIDQPEDNLDNQSVFCKLVKCITEAKKKRQVIIVTHNPNIAVACDSEQLIYCSIDKTNNKISYASGSIEDPDMRKHVIDVLEGTMPAFDLRRRKYQVHQ